MTCVSGHLTRLEFGPEFNSDWRHPPPESLFTAPITTTTPADQKEIAQNIQRQAQYASALFIWTDCDREGEHIGSEIVGEARKTKPGIQVKRARFSNIERAHILHAAKNLANLDDRQVQAVEARMELDIRIGYAFTRFLTNNLRTLGGPLGKHTFTYGNITSLTKNVPTISNINQPSRLMSIPDSRVRC